MSVLQRAHINGKIRGNIDVNGVFASSYKIIVTQNDQRHIHNLKWYHILFHMKHNKLFVCFSDVCFSDNVYLTSELSFKKSINSSDSFASCSWS